MDSSNRFESMRADRVPLRRRVKSVPHRGSGWVLRLRSALPGRPDQALSESSIRNPQSEIVAPTRYREVVPTSLRAALRTNAA
jgi:hypothetical protein